jgi:hypothetical protein
MPVWVMGSGTALQILDDCVGAAHRPDIDSLSTNVVAYSDARRSPAIVDDIRGVHCAINPAVFRTLTSV